MSYHHDCQRWLPMLALVPLVAGCADRVGADLRCQVFTTGHEQQVIESFAAQPPHAASQPGADSLDEALAALVARAFPPPNAETLAADAVSSLCEEYRRQIGIVVPAPTIDSWKQALRRGGSFESVLSDLDQQAPAGLNRSRLIEAGLGGILAATGWRQACVLTTDQAEEFRQLVKNRQQSSQPTPSEATAVRARSPKTGVLHVRISSFEGAGIAARVKQSLCAPTGGQVQVVLLDLRNNPGGRPEQANAVADLFLDNKILQVFAFRDGRRIAFRSNPGDVGLRLIVLANRFTGSAAEMLILALRDHRRAIVIGERTAGVLFGKDLQELRGGQVIVFRTEPTILSPRGEDYSLRGIPPDVAVPDRPTRRRDPVLERGLDLAGINQTSAPDR